MKNSWEIFLLGAVLVIGFGAGRITAKRNALAPVAGNSFDAQAKAYIDSKLEGVPRGTSSCGQLPQLIDRVTDLEKRMAGAKKFKALWEQVKGKRENLSETLNERRGANHSKLERLRNAELKKLKLAMGQACASVKDDKTH